MSVQQTDSNRLAPSQATVGPMCDIALDLLEADSPITADDRIFDVGCGKGAFLLHAARRTPCEQLVGIEYDPHLVSVARRAAAEAGFGGEAGSADCVGIEAERKSTSVDKDDVAAMDPSPSARVRVILADALKADLSDATIIFLYLVPEGMKLLAPRIVPLLRAGKTRVVTNAFSLPGCDAVACVTYKYMKVRLYTAASVPSNDTVDAASPVTAAVGPDGEPVSEAGAHASSSVPPPSTDDDVQAEKLQGFMETARAASAAASTEVIP